MISETISNTIIRICGSGLAGYVIDVALKRILNGGLHNWRTLIGAFIRLYYLQACILFCQ